MESEQPWTKGLSRGLSLDDDLQGVVRAGRADLLGTQWLGRAVVKLYW